MKKQKVSLTYLYYGIITYFLRTVSETRDIAQVLLHRAEKFMGRIMCKCFGSISILETLAHDPALSTSVVYNVNIDFNFNFKHWTDNASFGM